MRRFFVEGVEENRKNCKITGQDAKHMQNVLRLLPGEQVILFDGKGHEWDGVVLKYEKGVAHLEIIGEKAPLPEPPARISVSIGYLKDKKIESLIRPLTELGVSDIRPFFSRRSIPLPDGKKTDAKYERFRSIAIESLKQCRRSYAPSFYTPVMYEEMLFAGDAYDEKIIFWEEAGDRPGFSNINLEDMNGIGAGSVYLAFGPEGGFEEGEIEMAIEAGFRVLSLGPRILRAETAVITGVSIIQYFFGDLR